ncbi:MAG: tRNA (guanosine(37)-N1)-methyltransferase TrmD [Myxococcaceae bacterium]|nr:tRNA (guanosine(37)-N1)-methyltransferase TrmD [Myxococcaceae bacterium]MBH2006603.1 tRNA (guanosine(37)-N1)-methyltransferase TrmD [Myxococcaceae bacterium]
MKFSLVALFPESTRSILNSSMIARAQRQGLVDVEEVPIRDFAKDKHKTVDDAPCGGGAGQILRVDVVVSALRSVLQEGTSTRIILTDPAGKQFKQADAKRLASYEHLVFVCGRYEGIDARIQHYVDESLSIGDYVLTGGELAALVMIDATLRHIPGVLGNPESLLEESHTEGIAKEYPQYTKPIEFEEHRVPEVLLSGNHALIQAFRSDRSHSE